MDFLFYGLLLVISMAFFAMTLRAAITGIICSLRATLSMDLTARTDALYETYIYIGQLIIFGILSIITSVALQHISRF